MLQTEKSFAIVIGFALWTKFAVQSQNASDAVSGDVPDLYLVAAENGSQVQFELPPTSGVCRVYRFSLRNISVPWIELEKSTLNFSRHGDILTFRSVKFSDGGLYRLGCSKTVPPSKDSLLFAIVFNTKCTSNMSDEETFVDIGQAIQSRCEIRYSVLLNRLVKRAPPIQWFSTGSYQRCDDDDEIQTVVDGDDGSSLLLYRTCAIQTAQVPEVPPIACRLGYPIFHQLIRASGTAISANDRSTIWTSTTKFVRHAVTYVHVEQLKLLIQAGNHEVIQTYVCSADGFPKPSLRWWNVDRDTYVDGPMLNVTMFQDRRLLSFTSVERYVCVANNSLSDEQLSVEIKVTVPSDLPIYAQVIIGVVLLVVVGSVAANVAVAYRMTTGRRRKLQAADADARLNLRRPHLARSLAAVVHSTYDAISSDNHDISATTDPTTAASTANFRSRQKQPLPPIGRSMPPLDTVNTVSYEHPTKLTMSSKLDASNHRGYESIATSATTALNIVSTVMENNTSCNSLTSSKLGPTKV
jgi:hypothetical protein